MIDAVSSCHEASTELSASDVPKFGMEGLRGQEHAANGLGLKLALAVHFYGMHAAKAITGLHAEERG